MSTIHLNYGSLERLLEIEDDSDHDSDNDSDYDSNDDYNNQVTLTKRYKRIEQLFEEYCLFPSVIDDIVFKYIDTNQRIVLNCKTRTCRGMSGWFIILSFKYIDFIFDIEVSKESKGIELNMTIRECECECEYANIESMDNIGGDDKELCNLFMHSVYKKSMYLDYESTDEHKMCTMTGNMITMEYSDNEKRHYIIKSYRQFTNIIVIIKCIIRGIKKYYSI
jgi:hypothetical protein